MTQPGSAERLARLVAADGVVIFASDGQQLSVDQAWPDHPAAARVLRIPVGFGVTGLVARTGTPAHLAADVPRNALHRQLLGLPRTGGELARICVPAFGVDQVIAGVVAAHRPPTRPFTAEELAVLTDAAEPVGLTLHAEALLRTVRGHRSERDRLIASAISTQEAERRRIAFDLHDGVTTALASMAFHLSAADLSVSRLPDSAAAREQLAAARQLTDMAYQQTRLAISGLHSLVLDDLGLVAALESLVQTVIGRGTPEVDLFVDGADWDDVPDHAAAALYRIAQEALANAVRHARADRVVLSLRRVGASVVLGCTDDGIGFDQESVRAARAGAADDQHFGLSSIAERCALIEASLRIESVTGRGTTVLVELPSPAEITPG